MLGRLAKIATGVRYPLIIIVFFILSASPSFAQLIPKTNWTLAFVDSQETVGENGAATNGFDGNVNTLWHTQWFNINPNPPPPHEIQINLGAVYNVSGFRYLPRQDGSQNGRIGQYEFYVSSDGGNWGTPVAAGIFPNDGLEKEVTFTPKAGHYVRLRALSEVNGNPWTTMAELNVLGPLQIAPGNLIPKTNWTLRFVDSQEVLAEPTGAVKAFDGNASTFWHTRWSDINPDPPPPHEIQINLGAVYNVSGFRYLPRQDGSQNGWVGQFEFYVSSDGINWGTAVFTGTFGKNASEKEVLFTAKTGQYVRFRALSEVNGNPWTSMAELSVLGDLSSSPATQVVVTTPGANFTTSTSTNLGVTVETAGGSPVSTDNTTQITFDPTLSGRVQALVTGTLISPATLPAAVGAPATVRVASGLATVTLTDAVVETFAVAMTNNAGLTNPANASYTVQNGSNLIPKSNWTLKFVDSQETVAENGWATNSFDGNTLTIWHTQWYGGAPPPPHEIQVNLGAVYNVSGFRYLPRQDGTTNGVIGQYEFYVSSDGTNWGSAVATGTFPSTLVEKEVLFAAKSGQFVRLRALSEINGNPWTSMAELTVLQAGTGPNQAPDGVINTPAANATIVVGSAINFTGTGSDPDGNTPLTYRWSFGAGSGIPDSSVQNPGLVQFNNPGTFTVSFTVADALGLADSTPATRTITVQGGSSGVLIPHTNWTLQFVDSQEVVGENGAATNAFDGNVNTFWHTQWFNINPDPPPPHEIRINLGAVYDIGGFRYLPRQDGFQNGWIGQYEFYVSLDGTNWGSPVASGTFAKNSLEKEVSFIPRPGQYVRLRALSEINGNPWTSMAELNVLQAACITPSVNLIQPVSYYLQTTADLHVVADACLTSGQGVRLVIDGGSAAGGAEFDDYSSPYEVIFSGLTNSEHVVDAFVINAGGTPVAGIATHDQAIQVGIGDYYVAMGDSITQGAGDNVHTDDSSQDGRNTSGGYTPILDDLLTGAKGRPHNVANEGLSGAKSAAGVSLIPNRLQKHPEAQRFLIMYGTNDAGALPPVPSGLGLHPGDSGYPGSFKDNMQQIINAINGAGKLAILAKAPVALPLGGQQDTMVQEYNQVIDELVAIVANNITVVPPDFHAYFETHYPTEYFNSIHPNGIGYQSMANLWFQVLTQ